MPKEQRVNVRLPDDLAANVTDYADTHNLSDAEALRRFASRGAQYFGYNGGDSPTTLEQVAGQLFQIGFILAIAFLMLAFIMPLQFLFYAATGSISVAAICHAIAWAEPGFTDQWKANKADSTEDEDVATGGQA